jgi:hypothetical protein
MRERLSRQLCADFEPSAYALIKCCSDLSHAALECSRGRTVGAAYLASYSSRATCCRLRFSWRLLGAADTGPPLTVCLASCSLSCLRRSPSDIFGVGPASIVPMSSDKIIRRFSAKSLQPSQKAPSPRSRQSCARGQARKPLRRLHEES